MFASLKRSWERYKWNVGRVERLVGEQVGDLGGFVARKPVLVLVLSAVAALAFSLVLPFKIGGAIESRSEKLWCADSSPRSRDLLARMSCEPRRR
jgi:hypothetical protein